jgi:outer membrane protein TolC
MKGAPVKIFFAPSGVNRPLATALMLTVSLFLGTTEAWASGPDPFPVKPVLEDYLRWAVDHNPEVARAAGKQTALIHAAQGAGALADLKFGWGEMIVPVETRVGPQQRVFSLSQSFPWFGTLGLKETVAARQADAAGQEVRAQLNQVHHRIRAAWFDLAFLQGEIAIIRGNLSLARQAEASVRSTYEAGVGSFGDVLATQIEAEELESRLAGLKDRIKPVTTRLNLASGLAADHPVPTVAGTQAVSTDFPLPPDQVLWSLLEQNNPELAARKLEQESHRQAVELAGKAGYPELTLGLDYIMTGSAAMEDIPDSGKDPVIARLGVSIPLWGGKVEAGKKSSAGWLAASSADVTDTRRQLNTRFEAALYAWREAGRNADLYGKVLLDSGRQALEVTSARYRSGQASYLDLVTARKTLLGIELASLRAATDRDQALNDLASLLGVSFGDLAAAAATGDGPVHEKVERGNDHER